MYKYIYDKQMDTQTDYIWQYLSLMLSWCQQTSSKFTKKLCYTTYLLH